MHQLFVTLCSLLFALCHHTSLAARPVQAAELPMVTQSGSLSSASTMILPDRYQLAHHTMVEGSYADAGCTSCRRINSISVDR